MYLFTGLKLTNSGVFKFHLFAPLLVDITILVSLYLHKAAQHSLAQRYKDTRQS